MTGAGLTLPVALPLLTALAAPLVVRLPWAHWWLAAMPAGLTGYLFHLLGVVREGQPAAFHLPWVPALGLDLSLRADGLSLLYALLITGIGTLVVLYSGGYLAGEPSRGRFYGWLFVFMTGMLGVALADNLLLLFLFWEVTTLSSFMLIGFDHQRESAREAALTALVVTAFGGLAMVAGLILLGQSAGSFRISTILVNFDLGDSDYYPAIAGLILLGAATKSALFPFHFWLPAAMVAPTPVSAYLHAATMVKAGIYLLLRLQPVLGDSSFWHWGVGGLGAVTMVMGATLAPLQPDLKRLLAYATISVLGLLTFMIGLGSDA
ncbi:MAG: proton-conducting transporter membrane subunit, partial [Candidatus Competibacteraceae bacterium]|nr:proton-conducting transporter membrane subunit [Candidatus Competibacteraceae bacterium]